MATVVVETRLVVKPGVSAPTMWFNREDKIYRATLSDVVDIDKFTQTIANTVTYSLTDTPKWLAVVADQAVSFGWSGSADANNGSVVLVAGLPFFLTTGEIPTYSAGLDLATTAVDIETLSFYNGSGSTAVIRVFLAKEAE